jgi:MerR family transcriptional regulator, light-induced transcriptional regulator
LLNVKGTMSHADVGASVAFNVGRRAIVRHTMYTIRQASTLTGVGAPLIRAWERRYGVVKPARTVSGYRLYDDTAIQVLLAMRGLVDSGWTASEAARAIGAGEVAVGGPTAGPTDALFAPAAAAEAGATRRAALVGRFVAAAEASSPLEIERVLDDILGSASFEAVVDDLLLPAVAALGDAWAEGRISVAAEHAASAAVVRRLAVAFDAAGVATRPVAVVGMPPGARHELGALAFAVALRRRRIGVLYLGQDVTIDGWLDVVARTRARAAVIGVVTPADRESAAAVVERLLEHDIPLVAVGGAAADADLDQTGRMRVLPARVVEAAQVVAESVGRRA